MNYNPYYPNQDGYHMPKQNFVTGIQGIEAAKAYPLTPNTTGYFFDTDKDFLYIKETDQNGFPKKLRIIRCEEVTEEELSNPVPDKNFVTIDMLEGFISKYLDEHSYKPYIPRKERKNE